MSALEDRLAWQMRMAGVLTPEREVALIPKRRFRADFCWRVQRLVCEVDGGTFVSGRHSRGMGQASDCEKRNLLVLAGWRVLSVTTLHVRDGSALAWIEQALKC
jgi:very-short-patch-repair endonuclease